MGQIEPFRQPNNTAMSIISWMNVVWSAASVDETPTAEEDQPLSVDCL